MTLTAEQEAVLQKLGDTYGKIGHVEHEGHWLAFKTPNDVQVRDYKRKESSPGELPDRVWALLQQTIVCFDGSTDQPTCLAALGAFRTEYPFFDDNPRVQTVVSVLGGIVQAEGASMLGKACRVWRRTPKPSATPSVDGSAATTLQTPGAQATS